MGRSAFVTGLCPASFAKAVVRLGQIFTHFSSVNYSSVIILGLKLLAQNKLKNSVLNLAFSSLECLSQLVRFLYKLPYETPLHRS